MTYEIIDPKDVGVPDSAIILSARSGRHGLRHRLEELGYTLDDSLRRSTGASSKWPTKRRRLRTRDLEAIVSDEVEVFFKETFHLDHVQVSRGDHSIPTATVQITGPDGTVHRDADHGTGPVDAVYRAINRVIGEPNELIELSIEAITEGVDAVGRVTIRIRAHEPVNGAVRTIFSGHAPQTMTSSLHVPAYMFALNKLIAARTDVTAAQRLVVG